MAENMTWNEAYLMRLLAFNSVQELCFFLDQPDSTASLNRFDTPDDFHEEIVHAEEERELVEALEQLYQLPSANNHD
jgi:hypothetical protein